MNPINPRFTNRKASPFSRINLYSPARGIDNILLLDNLQRHLSLNCQIVGHIDPTDQHQLVLIDSTEISATKLQSWLQQQAQKDHRPKCALINTSMNSEHVKLMEWPQLVGIFYNNCSPEKLRRGLDNILEGGLWFPRNICLEFMSRRRRAPTQNIIQPTAMNITPRERQMLEGIHAGLSNAAIASMMRLSEHTIKSHMYSVYKKIGVKSRLEASNWLHDNYILLEQSQQSAG
ncbi:MAG: LuxR C-terminal-related transcriptional regulator [Cellvibrionaceae bacterium]